ncbi:MAG: hypothetical protein GY856_10655 [bacterium]|nr:hypothetical protein [bacterium]
MPADQRFRLDDDESVFPGSYRPGYRAHGAVVYQTVDGTAAADRDYLAASGNMILPPGTTAGTISVSVVGDTLEVRWPPTRCRSPAAARSSPSSAPCAPPGSNPRGSDRQLANATKDDLDDYHDGESDGRGF